MLLQEQGRCCKNKDAAADDSFAYELPKLLGFGK